MKYRLIPATLTLLVIASCVRNEPRVIVITSTPPPEATTDMITLVTPTEISADSGPPQGTVVPEVPPSDSSSWPIRSSEHVVQSGETLGAIATQYGVKLEALIIANQLSNPDLLAVGQVLRIPLSVGEFTSSVPIISDLRLVRGPEAQHFGLASFIAAQSGFVSIAVDTVEDQILDAAAVVKRVSLEFSVDPRVLLAFLELRAKWLSDLDPQEPALTYPITLGVTADGVDRSGLYRQLAWLANQLNRGFYGWKYRGLAGTDLLDGTSMQFSTDLNAGTVGIQFAIGLLSDQSTWDLLITNGGFSQLYASYFREGSPTGDALTSTLPPDQPTFGLPFARGEEWFFTGGPHGGWGSGSAWSAIDFAPPDDRPDDITLCYISTSIVRAVADGTIARSDNGVVVLDLDGDENESTGWSVLYLHIASQDRVAGGMRVKIGDPIGRASCEGGFSSATHLHIARRYDGEWIPANCQGCIRNQNISPLVMAGWTVFDLSGQEYQGFMQKDADVRRAEQGRNVTDNRVSW